MNGTIIQCLKEIKTRIPSEILNEAFMRKANVQYKSLDSILKEEVIVDVVLRKTNLYSGKLKKIELRQDYITELTSPEILGIGLPYPFYVIPPEAREYTDITSVIGVAFPITEYSQSVYAAQGYNSIQNKTSELLDNTFSSGTTYPTPFLLDNNTIKLDPPQYISVPWLLTCMLAYDSNFTNISYNMIPSLCKLCVTAAKMIIYNRLKIAIDLAYINTGAEIGAFKDIVDSYSDAADDLEKDLLDFRGAASFDKEQSIAMISLMNL